MTDAKKPLIDEKISNLAEKTKDIAEKTANTIFDEASFWLKSPETYYQLLMIIGAFALAYVVTLLLRTIFDLLKEPDKEIRTFSLKWFVRRSGRLIFPILVILLLSIVEPISQHFFKKIEVVNAFQRVTVVWILWVAVRAYVTSTLVRVIGLWMFLPAAVLQLFGFFEPVVSHLDGYGFTFGEVKVTLYTFVKAIFYVSIIIWIGKVVKAFIENKIRSNKVLTRPTKELFIKLFDIVLFTVLFLLTLNLIGIDLTALAVFGGALGVGIGFGLQKVASNFISGIILLTEKSININNLIEMDDGVTGHVRKLGARASVVETFDGKEVMVPNEDFITSRVSNLTYSSTNGRVDIAIGVSYESDMRQVHKLILEAAENYEGAITKSPDSWFNPKCYMREYGDNSVNFLLTFWLDDVNTGRWRAKSDIMFAIWDSFKEHGIEIPFPQRDLHIKGGLDVFQNQNKETVKKEEKDNNS